MGGFLNLKKLLLVLSFAAFLVGVDSIATHLSAPGQNNASNNFKLEPCKIAGVAGEAKCGVYDVFENRTAKNGRKIGLKILVIPGTGPKPLPDPLVYISGGPGTSAIEAAGAIAREFAALREERDLLFVDQRGAGESHPLNCDFYNPEDLQSYLGHFFPLEDVRKCRQQLEQKADLTLYTTPIAMDDLEEVRVALGYKQLNLFGGSYGTRAALVFLKRHPQSVRTITLHGVAPTDQYMPLAFAQHNERALQGIINECAGDQACKKAFPNLPTETTNVLQRLKKGPVEVEVRNPRPGKVRLSRDLAAEAIRYMLYAPGPASQVPFVLHRAAQGDFVPLAEAALRYRRELVGTGSNGMYLSITCAEDLPWIKPGEGEQMAANTFLGDYRYQQQRAACELWPRAPMSADHFEPTRSSVPSLILSGEWDPVTPPSNGELAAQHLPNNLHVVVPHGAHGFGGLEGIECINRLQVEFVKRGSVVGLDPSCVKNIRRRGFRVK